MIWGSVAENIKRELQRRVENIEQSIAWCEQYSWQIDRHRGRLELELQSLLADLQGLTEADQVYGCPDFSDLVE
ncbi:MAG: hypothetical protein IPP13_04160 [Kouleothrix sp.]|nr:hypothetical protein [Kouleothrix sp.]